MDFIEIQGIMVIGGVGTGGIVGSSAIALQAAVEERDIGKDVHCLPRICYSLATLQQPWRQDYLRTHSCWVEDLVLLWHLLLSTCISRTTFHK